jgi:serine/threonine protein kinase
MSFRTSTLRAVSFVPSVHRLPEPLATLLHSGELIVGKYRLERLVGRGGMSVVFAAEHETLRQRVAIKFLVEHGNVPPLAIARLLREARATVRIRSEHVTRVTDVDALATGQPFIVMEYLEGEDLDNLLRRSGSLGVAQAVDYVMEALEAVAEAHTLGIVHRDLKPENMFLVRRPDGRKIVKVLDFGISKLIAQPGVPPSSPATSSQAVLGSPYYMSPEQVQRSASVDQRADIWSIGVVLYELLAGEPPFQGSHTLKILQRILSEPPPSLRAKRSAVPEELERAIETCLQHDPALRFMHAGELARALLPFGSVRSHRSFDAIWGVIRTAMNDPDDQTSSD